MSNSVITLQLNQAQEEKLYQTFRSSAAAKVPPYARWQLRPEGCVITCYTSGKTVFQGKDAAVYASSFSPVNEAAVPAVPSCDTLPQAGSDEVGTGDYFGPVCVAAAIVDERTLGEVHRLGVRDSKAVTDADIRRIAPKLISILPHSILILDCSRYNLVHETNNINAIKAKLHNQAYVNLEKKYGLPDFRIIDQFTPGPSYYRYLKDQPRVIRGMHFETKAENKYPSVGAASILARYAFLLEWDAMEKKYGMKLQKGAGEAVDRCAAAFAAKFGFDELQNAVKLHFRNTEKLKGIGH